MASKWAAISAARGSASGSAGPPAAPPAGVGWTVGAGFVTVSTIDLLE